MNNLYIQAHCRDCCNIVLPNGKQILGYVPDLGFGCGDDIELEIDFNTGKVVGWERIKELVEEKMENLVD